MAPSLETEDYLSSTINGVADSTIHGAANGTTKGGMNGMANGSTNGATATIHTTTDIGVSAGHDTKTPYVIEDQWFGQKSHMKIIGLGSGIGGLALAYKLPRLLTNYSLTLYEKAPHLAGTWYENTYPGVACDVPAHIYTYTFQGNPNWSTFYAEGPEIFEHFKDVAHQRDLSKDIVFDREVMSIAWDDTAGIWNVTLKNPRTEEITYDWCHVFLNTGGRLNKWKMPDIEGLDLFQGGVTHSAHWDHSIETKGKTVAIIGTGSSAIQVTPQLQKTAEKLVCFMRSATWIAPPVASNVANATKAEMKKGSPNVAEDMVNGKAVPDLSQVQFSFTEEQKKRYREDPAYHLAFRKKLEASLNLLTEVFIMGTPTQKLAYVAFKDEMLRRIGPGFPELKKRLIPTWAPGCRRMTPGDGYLEALTQPNVQHVYDEISHCTANGLVTADGVEHKVDVIICATGFHIPFQPHFEIIGKNGLKMKESWEPDPNCYLGIAGPQFPNYWITMGPRGPWGNGAVIPAMETSCEYFATVITKMQMEGIKCMEPRQDATDELMEHIDAFHVNSVWTQPCKSWYKKGIADGRPWLWCGGVLSYLAAIKAPRYEDYHITYKNRNRWAYLGNGLMKANYAAEYETEEAQTEALAPYIRNEDTPWDFDY